MQQGRGETPSRGTQGSKGSEAEMDGAVDQEDRELSGQGLQREVFQRGLKVFGIYPVGTGEPGKVLELMDDTVKAVLR